MSFAVACAAGSALAQRGLPPVPGRHIPQYEMLDEGIADRGPDRVSLRYIEVDLRQDSEFDHIYSAPGRPDLLMRRDGAVTAVFPLSFYNVGKGGMTPLIPPGTIFLIGAPCANDPAFPAPIAAPVNAAASLPANDTRWNSTPVARPMDSRVSSETYSPTPHSPAPDDHTALIYMNEERARAQRLREIAERLGPM